MGSSATSHSDAASPPRSPDSGVDHVVWRRLGRHLWVGRSGDTHVGIIEEGRRFTLTDANECVHPGFGSLEAAQSATGPIAIVHPGAADVSRVERRSHPWSGPLGISVLVTGALLSWGALMIAVLQLGASAFTPP